MKKLIESILEKSKLLAMDLQILQELNIPGKLHAANL